MPMFRPGPQMEYCVDESGTKTLEEIKNCNFIPVRAYYPAFGITTNAVWVRFRILPDPKATTSRDFELASSLPRSVHFYRLHQDGTVADRLIYDEVPPRPQLIPHHYFLFPIQNVTEPESIYMRAQSVGGLNMPVFIWNARSFPYVTCYALVFLPCSLASCLPWHSTTYCYLYPFETEAISTMSFTFLFVTEYFAFISGHAAYLVPDSWTGKTPALGPVVVLAATIFALIFSRKFLLLPEKRPRLAMAANVCGFDSPSGFDCPSILDDSPDGADWQRNASPRDHCDSGCCDQPGARWI